MNFNLEKFLKEKLIGKVFVDSEYSSKGDFGYYEAIGTEYPPFDEVIKNVHLVQGSEDVFILLHFKCGSTYKLSSCDTLEIN